MVGQLLEGEVCAVSAASAVPAASVTPAVERRGAVRHAVEGEAEVVFADGMMLFRGTILDIAEGGCYIETRARLRMKPGTPVTMVFQVRSRVFRIAATSRALRPDQGAGFLFGEMSGRARMQLRELIAELGAEAAEAGPSPRSG